jgi:L-seryl-tRNA(Ser) seleniumtransferase
MSDFRQIPSVEQLLELGQVDGLVRRFSRPLTVRAIHEVLGEIRQEVVASASKVPNEKDIVSRVTEKITSWNTPSLVDVINATGVILHTNLGRAPLSKAALVAIQRVVGSYNNLEFDLNIGKRGSRMDRIEKLLTQITGAEAGLVVNNNAAAVLLALTAMTKRRKVIISRSQLIEIGGGFRVSDVMAQSGAKLVEVGTTNRVHVEDFRDALDDQTVAIFTAHHSNFKIFGFTNEPTLEELADLAHQRGILLIDDLGSGALLDTTQFGLSHEPMVQESVKFGADVVCFSGDKLLGGPQAGIIVGKKDLIQKLRKYPLMRALRPDKSCLAALEATLQHYLRNEAAKEIPIWKMITTPTTKIKQRATVWVKILGSGVVIEGKSTIGGGSLPEETLPTFLLSLDSAKPNLLAAKLRRENPPIIARVEKDKVVFDPRTVFPEQDDLLLMGVQHSLQQK